MATTITTIIKAPLGVEDISIDSTGSGATANTPTSRGGVRAVRKLNASHIPTTVATRAKTTAAGVTLDETNVDTTLQQLLTDNAAQGIPDNITIEVVGGVQRAKAGGITASHIATGAVGSDEIAALVVTQGKLGLLSVGSAQLISDASVDANRAVTTNHIRDQNITGPKIADAVITNEKLVDATIKAGKLADLPAFLPKLAGNFSFASAPNPFSITVAVAGVLTTDIIIVTMKSTTLNTSLLRFATCLSNGNITLQFNAFDPGASVASYVVFRAVTP